MRMCDYFGCLSLADFITDEDAKVCAGHYRLHHMKSGASA